MCQEPQFLDENGTYIWDALDVKCCNILADHPYYYYKLLAQRPRNYCQLSIDKNHEAFMRRFFPEIELGPFLPLGGTQISHPVLKKMPERSMDVLPAIMPRPPGLKSTSHVWETSIRHFITR